MSSCRLFNKCWKLRRKILPMKTCSTNTCKNWSQNKNIYIPQLALLINASSFISRRHLRPFFQFSSVQLLSHVQLFTTSWTAAHQASLSITSSQSLHRLVSIESLMPSNYLILYWTLLLSPSIFPSISIFSNKSGLHRVTKVLSFSFSISPSNEYSGLISFRIDWFDLLAVQWILKSLLQHHSSKASVLQGSPFFLVQLSHP